MGLLEWLEEGLLKIQSSVTEMFMCPNDMALTIAKTERTKKIGNFIKHS